jgi:GTP-binding protein
MPPLPATRFELSAARIDDLPPSGAPEIAFAGRSNAGKSSAINTLVRHTRLAFVSKTPGRTQLINFFRCGDRGFLVDLPGYGYAQVPEAVRRTWQGALEHYLRKRRGLVGLVLIMDARHPLTPLDRQMLDWFAPTGRPVHVLLTKADKLNRSEGALTLQRVSQTLAQYPAAVSVQLFSSLKRTGIEEAETVILGWFDAPEAQKKAPG